MFLFLQGWANHSGGDWAGMSKSRGPMDQYAHSYYIYGRVIQLPSALCGLPFCCKELQIPVKLLLDQAVWYTTSAITQSRHYFSYTCDLQTDSMSLIIEIHNPVNCRSGPQRDLRLEGMGCDCWLIPVVGSSRIWPAHRRENNCKTLSVILSTNAGDDTLDASLKHLRLSRSARSLLPAS